MLGDTNFKRLFPTLDGIRGLAAILVVIRHVPSLISINFQESYLAVDLFFILSGAVIANAYESRLRDGLSSNKFIWFRLVRIYPMYIFGSLISLIYWLVNGNSPGNIYVIIVLSILLIPNIASLPPFPMNGPAWSLFSELVANVAYAKNFKRMTGKFLAAIMLLSAGGIAAILYTHGNMDVGYNTKSTPLALIRVSYSFFAGILIYRLYSVANFSFEKRSYASFAPWVILLTVALILTSAPNQTTRAIFDFLAITILFPAIVFISLHFDPRRFSLSIFKFLGVISYPIYAIHAPMAKWIPVVAGSGPGSYLNRYPIEIGFAFVAILVPLSWILDKFADIPLRKKMADVGAKIQVGWKARRLPSSI